MYYEVQWAAAEDAPSVRTRNVAGTSGWAHVRTVAGRYGVETTFGLVDDGRLFRMHPCSETPCKAHWDTNKYGGQGQPLHLIEADAPVAHLPLSMVAPVAPDLGVPAFIAPIEPALNAEFPEGSHSQGEPGTPGEPAVAGGEAVPEAPTVSEPVAGEPAVAELAVAEPEVAPDAFAFLPEVEAAPPPVPASACLGNPFGVMDLELEIPLESELPTGWAAAAVSAESAVDVCQPNAHATQTLVNLARDIGHPLSVVGYSAFLLCALMEKRQPITWEGILKPTSS